MDVIEKYSEHSTMQNDIGMSIIRRYFRLLTWKQNERILDVGMGDGKFTVKYLLPALPKDIDELIGCDISADRVQYAIDNYSVNKVKYIRMDIQSSSLGNTHYEAFDHVFSFFCLHWVPDLRTAFKNIFNMLKTGGEMVITVAEHGVECALDRLSKCPRWSQYGHKEYITSFVNVKDTLPVWKEIVEAAGFIDLNCFREGIAYRQKSEYVVEELYKSVNPVASQIPPEELDDYYRDYLKEIRSLEMISEEICPDTQKKIFLSRFNQITIFARKPGDRDSVIGTWQLSGE